MSKRNFDVIVCFSVEAETPEEAAGKVFGRMFVALPDDMVREIVGVWGEASPPEEGTPDERINRLENLSITFARAIRYIAEQSPGLLGVHDDMHAVLSEMGGLYAWEKASPAAKDAPDVPR